MAEKHGYEALIASRRSESTTGTLTKARLLHRDLLADSDDFHAGLAAEIVAHLEAGQ